MEGAVAARVNFNASTTAGVHISSRAGPGIGANIFPRVNAKIFNSLFFSFSDKTSTDVSHYASDEIFADVCPHVSEKTIADISLRADDEIFFRSRAQERQTSRSDHSGRRRASERFA
ncbi:MAG TPA: hypothetical protein VKS99_09645 [Blastocatellia bacterium]|nr:hypothetical protein [Blastocatellia bacterium]